MIELHGPTFDANQVLADDFPQLASLGIDAIGITMSQDGYSRPPRHKHECANIHIGFSGLGRVLVSEKWHPLPLGKIYYTPGHIPCEINCPAETRWEFVWVRFLHGINPGKDLPEDRATLLDGDPSDLLWTYRRLYHECMGIARSSIVRCLSEMIAYHARELVSPTEPVSHLSHLWEVVCSNLGHNWTLDDLSEAAGRSRESLRMLCHTETGTSPLRYVTIRRMRKAAEILSEYDLSVRQVAKMVGYKNPYNFSTAFRRHYKMPPSSWRERGGISNIDDDAIET